MTLSHVAQKIFEEGLWYIQNMYDVMDHFNNCHSRKTMCTHVTEITWVKQSATQSKKTLVFC